MIGPHGFSWWVPRDSRIGERGTPFSLPSTFHGSFRRGSSASCRFLQAGRPLLLLWFPYVARWRGRVRREASLVRSPGTLASSNRRAPCGAMRRWPECGQHRRGLPVVQLDAAQTAGTLRRAKSSSASITGPASSRAREMAIFWQGLRRGLPVARLRVASRRMAWDRPNDRHGIEAHLTLARV